MARYMYQIWHGTCTKYGTVHVPNMARYMYQIWHGTCTKYGTVHVPNMARYMYQIWHKLHLSLFVHVLNITIQRKGTNAWPIYRLLRQGCKGMQGVHLGQFMGDIKIPHSRMTKTCQWNIGNLFVICMRQVTKGHFLPSVGSMGLLCNV